MGGLRKLAGGLAAATRQALVGPCAIGECASPSVGYIQGTHGRPAGVCAEHADRAVELGYTVEREPLS